MSTPKYTKKGVKVKGAGGQWFCGHCGKYLADTFGFSDTVCSKCGINNRPDFSPNLASERVQDIISKLARYEKKMLEIGLLVVPVGDAIDELYSVKEELKYLERYERDMFASTGLGTYDEPTKPPPWPS